MKQSFQEQHPTLRILLPLSKIRKQLLSLQKSLNQEASEPGTMLLLCHPYQQNGFLSRSWATKKCVSCSFQLPNLSDTRYNACWGCQSQHLPHLASLPAFLLFPIIPFSVLLPALITSVCSSKASDDSSSPLNYRLKCPCLSCLTYFSGLYPTLVLQFPLHILLCASSSLPTIIPH